MGARIVVRVQQWLAISQLAIERIGQFACPGQDSPVQRGDVLTAIFPTELLMHRSHTTQCSLAVLVTGVGTVV